MLTPLQSVGVVLHIVFRSSAPGENSVKSTGSQGANSFSKFKKRKKKGRKKKRK